VTVSNNPADAVSAYRNSSIVIYAAQFTGNTTRQVVAESASSAHLTLASTSIDASSSSSDAIAAVGTSTLQIDAGVSVTARRAATRFRSKAAARCCCKDRISGLLPRAACP